MTFPKSTVLALCLTYFLVTVTAQDVPVIVEGPEDQTNDEGAAVFMTCGVQYLDRTTHVVSWVLGSTIISDDGTVRKNDLDDLIGDGASDRYLLTLGIIPEDPPNTPRQYNFELFITSAQGVDNGGEFHCAVCPKDSDGLCNGNLEYESRVATLEVRYRPDTTLYPKCINPSNSPTDTVVVLGVQSTLTCESEIANPPVNLQWRKNDQIVEGTMPPDTAGMRRLDYDIIPVLSDDGSIFKCTVSSDYFDDLTNTECSLPRIKVVSIPSVTVKSPGEVKVGQQAQFVCSATSETNAAMQEFQWEVENISDDRYTVTQSGLESILRVSKTEKSDHGATVTCFVTDSDNQVGEGSAMILIAGEPIPTGVTPPTGTLTDPGKAKSTTSLIAGTVVAGFILIVLIIAFIFWCCSRRSSMKSTKAKKPVGTSAISMEPQSKPYSISADVSEVEKSQPIKGTWNDEPDVVQMPHEKRTGSPDGVDPRHWWNEKMAPESDNYTPDGQSYPPSHQDGDFNNPGYDLPEYRHYDDKDMDDQKPYDQGYNEPGYPDPSRYDDRLQGYGDERPFDDQDFSNQGYEGSYPSGLDAGRGEHYEPYGYPDRRPDGQEGSPPESSTDYYPDNYGNPDNYGTPDNYGNPDNYANPDDYNSPNYGHYDNERPEEYNSPDNRHVDGYGSGSPNYGQYNPEDYGTGNANNYDNPDNYGNPQYPEDQYYDDRNTYPNNNSEFYPGNDEQYPPSNSDQYPPSDQYPSSDQYPPSDAYPGSDPYEQGGYEQPPPGSPGYNDQSAVEPAAADLDDDAYNSMGTPSYV